MLTVRHTIAALLAAGLFMAGASSAQTPADAREVVTRAAEALGGAQRIEALRTIRLRGYGHDAYQDGGSLITTEPTAPEKMTIITAYERVIDLTNHRTRVRAKQSRAFVFAAQAMMEGRPIEQSLDGEVAFDTAAGGAARRLSSEVATRRRMELLAHPIVAVRAALESGARVTNRRTEGAATLVDVATPTGEAFTLAVTAATGLPRWVRWVGPHDNLGDLTYRAEFSAYEPVNGVLVPMSFNTVSDWKNNVQLRLHVDRYVLDGDVGDLAAPAAVRSAPEPVPLYTVDASSVAPGVWLLTGNGGANSVLLEFEDHLSLFEVPTSRAWTAALIEKARSTVPGKPVTEAIISHHHFDHTGGLRTAIAEGLTIVTQTGNVEWFEELAERRVTVFPDALSRDPKPIKTRAVDDHLRLSDAKLTVDVYRVVSNNHMAHGLLAYLPEHRLLIQGDLFDMNWEVYFWGNTYADNVAHRKLDVERDVPIHGRVLPIAEVRAKLAEQTRNAEQLCARVESAGLSMPGCPLAWDDGVRRPTIAVLALLVGQGAAASPEAERLLGGVAQAMGGADAILAVRTLQADGYGMEAYFWGGGNVTADREAPQKWAENPNFSSLWDFTNDRYRTQYRHNFLFPFGGIFGHSFSLSSWGVDSGVGYTISPAGVGSRLADWTTGGAWFKPDGTVFRTYESLSHPLAAVRAVLSGAAVPENLRIEDGMPVVDLIIDEGYVTLGIESRTLLPRFVRWSAPHQNLGEVVITKTFVGYQNFDGVQLPFTWVARIDWRDTLIETRMLDAYYVNSGDAPNIAAPAAVLEQPEPAAAPPAAPITVTKVADGLWHLNPGGHTVIEFADHLVIFEMGGTAAQARAAIALANTLVPGKPLTHLIVSHHHFDHTLGFRAAVEAGLTVISHWGNEEILRDMATRPAPNFADLVPNPNGAPLKFVPVTGRLRLQDERMTLDIYEVVKHNHMANAVFAYAPESRTFIEADLATPANQFSFWAEAYEDNLEHYGIEVATVSPNHVARPMTHEETLAWIAEGVPRALARCDELATLGRPVPGCPPYIHRDWDERGRR